MRLIVANPRGFCAGVDRAIAIVEEVLRIYPTPIFVRHALVHNNEVVSRFEERGVRFVETLDEVPESGVVILSAHGSAPTIYDEARRRNLRLFDATCPLVTKVHLEVARHARAGRTVVVVGHRGHVEVQGIVGHYDASMGGGIHVVEDEDEARALHPSDPAHIGCVTQTTLAVDQTQGIIDVLVARFPALVRPARDDICYATQNRQGAVRRLAEDCPVIIVIGAPHSSNSRRLVEVAQRNGSTAYLVERATDIDARWFLGIGACGLTASASAPESIVASTIGRIRTLVHPLTVEEMGAPETIAFRLPAALRRPGDAAPDASTTGAPALGEERRVV